MAGAIGTAPSYREMEPVREFTGDHRRLSRDLMLQLQAQRAQLVEMLAKGQGADTFDRYRYRVGQIEGLDIAISLCKQTQDKLQA